MAIDILKRNYPGFVDSGVVTNLPFTLTGTLDFSGGTLTLPSAQSYISTSPTLGIGYATGAGGAVTQATNKSTGVTLNKITGQITTNNAALAAGVEVAFTVTNSTVAATDVVIESVASGPVTPGTYLTAISAVAAGSFDITITNASAGSLSEALVINFAVVKAVAA